jgi:hypothetical protein
MYEKKALLYVAFKFNQQLLLLWMPNTKLRKNQSSSFKHEIRGGHRKPYQLCEKQQLVALKPSFFYDVTRHNLVGWSWKFRDKLSDPSSRLPTKVGKKTTNLRRVNIPDARRPLLRRGGSLKSLPVTAVCFTDTESTVACSSKIKNSTSSVTCGSIMWKLWKNKNPI